MVFFPTHLVEWEKRVEFHVGFFSPGKYKSKVGRKYVVFF